MIHQRSSCFFLIKNILIAQRKLLRVSDRSRLQSTNYQDLLSSAAANYQQGDMAYWNFSKWRFVPGEEIQVGILEMPCKYFDSMLYFKTKGRIYYYTKSGKYRDLVTIQSSSGCVKQVALTL